MDVIEKNGIPVCQFREWETFPCIVHGFSTRLGGLSAGPYRSFNLAFHTGEERTTVLANRQRWAKALGISPGDLVAAQQVHGSKVAVVTRRDRGRGSSQAESALEGIDGLLTSDPGVYLLGFFADCVPLYFVDPVNRVVGLSHAGWKGTFSEIGLHTVQRMQEAFGSDPKDLYAGIGPSIGPCCYEVSPDLAQRFAEKFGGVTAKRNGRVFLDLWKANRRILKRAGVAERRIVTSEWCTACRTDLFYSHRRLREPTGRMAAVIGIRHGNE